MIAAPGRAGGDTGLTIYPGVGHDAWTPTYVDPMFYRWLLQHRRSARGPGLDPSRSSEDSRRLMMDPSVPVERCAIGPDPDYRPVPDPR
jgi:hypothetical protein